MIDTCLFLRKSMGYFRFCISSIFPNGLKLNNSAPCTYNYEHFLAVPFQSSTYFSYIVKHTQKCYKYPFFGHILWIFWC